MTGPAKLLDSAVARSTPTFGTCAYLNETSTARLPAVRSTDLRFRMLVVSSMALAGHVSVAVPR